MLTIPQSNYVKPMNVRIQNVEGEGRRMFLGFLLALLLLHFEKGAVQQEHEMVTKIIK